MNPGSVPIYEGAFQHLHLLVMDPYDVALTKWKRDSDKDFQDILRLAEKIPFDLDLFENAIGKNSAIILPAGLKKTTSHSVVGKRQYWKTEPGKNSAVSLRSHLNRDAHFFKLEKFHTPHKMSINSAQHAIYTAPGSGTQFERFLAQNWEIRTRSQPKPWGAHVSTNVQT